MLEFMIECHAQWGPTISQSTGLAFQDLLGSVELLTVGQSFFLDSATMKMETTSDLSPPNGQELPSKWSHSRE